MAPATAVFVSRLFRTCLLAIPHESSPLPAVGDDTYFYAQMVPEATRRLYRV